MTSTALRFVDRAYVVTSAATAAVFLGGAALLAVTLPYHNWDSFAFGDWSRTIASGGSIDPSTAGPLSAGRPVFYILQGALWSLTGGVSFTAGRLLSLGFAIGLITFVALSARSVDHDHSKWLRGATVTVAAIAVIGIPAFSGEAVAGDSDVPAAAMVALCLWLVVRRRSTLAAAVVLGVASLLTALTKPTVIAPLAGLILWLLLDRAQPLRERLAFSVAPLAAGLLAGVGYLEVMATRFNTWLLPFLRTGTSEGLWAQRAAGARTHAVVGLSFMGDALRLPLAFGLIYGCLRLLRVAHRHAAVCAFAGALAWATLGPYAIGISGPFASADQGFMFVGFALLLALTVVTRAGDEPSRSSLGVSLAIGLPPLLIWAYTTAYVDRLAATAWPGLTLLIAISITPALRVLSRASWTLALAPLTVFIAVAWIGLGSLDGLHGYQWVEYRSLGRSGVWDKQRALNIVLPQVQSALALVEPLLGRDGRLSVSDPRFAFFLPGRVDTGVALHCRDIRMDAVFILLTSDESVQSAHADGGLATPDEWSRCRSPKLKEVPNSPSGYAVFVRASS